VGGKKRKGGQKRSSMNTKKKRVLDSQIKRKGIKERQNLRQEWNRKRREKLVSKESKKKRSPLLKQQEGKFSWGKATLPCGGEKPTPSTNSMGGHKEGGGARKNRHQKGVRSEKKREGHGWGRKNVGEGGKKKNKDVFFAPESTFVITRGGKKQN